MDEKSRWADALRCALAVIAGFSIALIAGAVWAGTSCEEILPAPTAFAASRP